MNLGRVMLVGSHSVGKTTLARWIRDTYRIPLLTEVARVVLAEREDKLPVMAGDLAAVTDYQEELFRRQIAVEEEWDRRHTNGYVSDRAVDNLAYTAWRAAPGTVARLLTYPSATEYLARLRQARVFFVRPHASLLVEDGTRTAVNWETIVRLDGAMMMLLEMLDVPYIPVWGLEMADRARLVEAVLGRPPL